MYSKIVLRTASILLILSLNILQSSARNLSSSVTHDDIKEGILKLQQDLVSRIEYHANRSRTFSSQLVLAMRSLDRRIPSIDAQGNTLKAINKRLENIEAHLKKEDNVYLATTIKEIAVSQRRFEDILEDLLTRTWEIINKVDLVNGKTAEASDTCAKQVGILEELKLSLHERFQENGLKKEFENLFEKERTLLGKIESYIQQANSLSGNLQYSTEGRLSDIFESISRLTNRVAKTEHNSTNQAIVKLSEMVKDVNRRTEYEVDRIITTLTLLVKDQGTEIKSNLKDAFAGLLHKIVAGQNSSSHVITDFVGKELSALWRQMGSMYQILEVSKPAIEKILESTDKYFNGSITALKKLDSSILSINSQTEIVEENLNTLQGHMSLIAQEFNNTKHDLIPIFNYMNQSLKQIRNGIPVDNPGPHPIQGGA